MVSALSLVFMVISVVAIILLPIGLAIYLYVTKRISLIAILVGVLGFFISQVLIRLPLLGALSQSTFYQQMAAMPVVMALFLSVTAGLFEETSRWIGFRYFLNKRLEHKNALAHGVGHGGFEAIFLVGLTYINNIVISVMINNGTFDTVIGPQLGIQAEAVRNQLIATSPGLFLVGGLERVFAITFHIALSVLVFLGVRHRKPVYYWLAVAAHTLFNLVAVVLSIYTNVWVSELFVGLFAAGGLWFILKSRGIDARMAASRETGREAATEAGG